MELLLGARLAIIHFDLSFCQCINNWVPGPFQSSVSLDFLDVSHVCFLLSRPATFVFAKDMVDVQVQTDWCQILAPLVPLVPLAHPKD